VHVFAVHPSKASSGLDPLRKLGYQLYIFGFRPSSARARPNVSSRAECEYEFGDVVRIRGINDGNEIGVAGCQIKRLVFDPKFFTQIPAILSALARLLNRADSLICPIHRNEKLWHVVLHLITRRRVVPADDMNAA
jgi:hypothetical protein